LHVAQRFEQLLEAYKRPDGSRWTGQQIDEATSGVGGRSYVTNLRKGRIESPGYEKMLAIARAMGFPPEAWFDERAGRAPSGSESSEEGRGISGRVEHLFRVVKNPRTGEPYTIAQVARMTLGDLSGGRRGRQDRRHRRPNDGSGGGSRRRLRRAHILPGGSGHGPVDPRRGNACGTLRRNRWRHPEGERAAAREGKGDCPRDSAAVRGWV
jgi:transcriptional regulator with XRE-family HTH domain